MATTPALTVADLLRAALGAAHETLEGTMSDVTDEVANRPAPGSSNSAGSSYAHALLAEDGVVNGIMRGQNPLFASSWAGRTGTDRPMPMPGMVVSTFLLRSTHFNIESIEPSRLKTSYFGSPGFMRRNPPAITFIATTPMPACFTD